MTDKDNNSVAVGCMTYNNSRITSGLSLSTYGSGIAISGSTGTGVVLLNPDNPNHYESCDYRPSKPTDWKRKHKNLFYVGDVFRPSIYLLYFRSEVVYVGQSINPYSRITTHMNNTEKNFEGFRILHCKKERLNHWEKILIEAYNPHYNKMHKKYKNNLPISLTIGTSQ